MINIRDITIKSKLIAVIMAACIVSLVFAGAAFIGWQYYSLRKTLVQNLSIQAKMIGENSQVALSFGQPYAKEAEAILKSLRAEPSIVFGAVYDKDWKIFATYNRTTVEARRALPSSALRQGHKFSQEFLTVAEPIVTGKEQIGTVSLVSDLEPLYAMLRRNVSIIITVLLVVSVGASLMASVLQRIISKPILTLADVARVVSNNKQYSVRAAKQSNDEVGVLIDAFNGMLEQIQQRDAALVGANTELEQKVTDRTAKLREEVVVRRKAEEALAETVRKLTRANAELSEFTRIAAHDLKTPLRAIGTLADWIADDYAKKADKDGQISARFLLGRAKRMSSLLDAVMSYTEITIINRVEEPVDLNSLVEEMIAAKRCPEKVRIVLENCLPVVVGDAKLLAQVFRNLLSNAVKYIDKPQGLIKVGCEDDGEFWRLYVADNGCGIEEKYFGKLFKIFQILANRDDTEDVGIGLAIVKKIVELYDGRVWVESQPGQGSTFYFTLPKERKQNTALMEELLVGGSEK